MAIDSNVVSATPGTGGFVTIKFKDNHTESMPIANAVANNYMDAPGTNTVLKPGAKVATIGITGPGGYGNTALVSDPMGSSQTAGSNYTVPVNGQQVSIGALLQKANDPKVLAQIGQSLREYGIIGKGIKSQNSIINAYTSVLVKAAATSMNPNDWMAAYKAGGGGVDTAAPAGPQTNLSIRNYTPDTIRSVADQIYVNTLGRKVTDADLAKLVTQLNAKEKASPTKTVSTPNAAGTVTSTTTSGGLDETGFITQQAQQMPEYQRAQNINFSSWLDKAMNKGQPSIGSLLNG